MTNRELHHCIKSMHHYLKALSLSTDQHELVIDGSMFSPSDRVLPGGDPVYQNGTDDQWETFRSAVDRATDQFNMFWEDGCLFKS